MQPTGVLAAHGKMLKTARRAQREV